jgi:hypothetical protein
LVRSRVAPVFSVKEETVTAPIPGASWAVAAEAIVRLVAEGSDAAEARISEPEARV